MNCLTRLKQIFREEKLELYEKEAIDFWLSEYTEEEIEKLAKTKHLYIAKLNEKIVGSGIVGKDGNMAYLSGVFVDPTIQGKGIGRKLIKVLEKDEICQKYKKVYLTAAISACKFYLNLDALLNMKFHK